MTSHTPAAKAIWGKIREGPCPQLPCVTDAVATEDQRRRVQGPGKGRDETDPAGREGPEAGRRSKQKEGWLAGEGGGDGQGPAGPQAGDGVFRWGDREPWRVVGRVGVQPGTGLGVARERFRGRVAGLEQRKGRGKYWVPHTPTGSEGLGDPSLSTYPRHWQDPWAPVRHLKVSLFPSEPGPKACGILAPESRFAGVCYFLGAPVWAAGEATECAQPAAGSCGSGLRPLSRAQAAQSAAGASGPP